VPDGGSIIGTNIRTNLKFLETTPFGFNLTEFPKNHTMEIMHVCLTGGVTMFMLDATAVH
jgi:hypothetical protein